MVTRLTRGGHDIVAHDRSGEAIARAGEVGARGAASLEELVSAVRAPRAIWVMVPAGAATESVVAALADLLAPGDAIIDGGNTHFHDDVRRAETLSARNIDYVDAGTSGGIWGLQEGYCLMVGGKVEVCRRLEPVFTTLLAAAILGETLGRRQMVGGAFVLVAVVVLNFPMRRGSR
jgi:6-phosphogluconate dehydrogenase